MKTLRCSLLALAALALLALPAQAQNHWTADTVTFAAGPDTWQTTTDTYITLTDSDWRALCGASGPSQQIALKGGNLAGLKGGDTVIQRLDDAKFGSDGTATVRIQTAALSFVSQSTSRTPCGDLDFAIGLDPNVTQRVGTMTIVRESADGGTFHADVLVDGVVTALADDEAVGSLPFSGTLKNPEGGTPWSINPPVGSSLTQKAFYPGVNPVDRQLVPVWRLEQILWALHAYKLSIQDLATPGPIDDAEPTQF